MFLFLFHLRILCESGRRISCLQEAMAELTELNTFSPFNGIVIVILSDPLS